MAEQAALLRPEGPWPDCIEEIALLISTAGSTFCVVGEAIFEEEAVLWMDAGPDIRLTIDRNTNSKVEKVRRRFVLAGNTFGI